MKPTTDTNDRPSTGLRQSIAVARVAARGLLQSRLPSMSAALSFRTLFALIPILVISLVIVRAVAGPEGVGRGLRQVLDYTGITSLIIAEAEDVEDPLFEFQPPRSPAPATDAPPQHAEPPPNANAQAQPPTESSTEPATEGTTDASPEPDTPVQTNPADPQLTPETDDRVDRWITERVERIMTVSLPAIGAVGFATLVYAALGLLIEIERSFNHVYRTRQTGNWVRRLTQYWTVLTLGGVFLLGTFYAGDKFQEWAATVFGSDATGIALRLVGFAITVFISTLLFFVAYQAIPATRVHVRAALGGAFLAALLWEIGKWALTQSVSYFVDSSTYAKIYGALALAPVFMLWINYTWLIVLFGLQVTYGLQHLSTWNESDRDDRPPTIADPGAVVALAAFVAERFREGQPAEVDAAAKATGLPAATAGDLLDRMADAGLIHALPDDASVLTLSRPAGTIHLKDLIAIGRAATLPGDDEPHPWSAAWRRIRGAQDDAVANQTLADVIGPPPTQPPPITNA